MRWRPSASREVAEDVARRVRGYGGRLRASATRSNGQSTPSRGPRARGRARGEWVLPSRAPLRTARQRVGQAATMKSRSVAAVRLDLGVPSATVSPCRSLRAPG